MSRVRWILERSGARFWYLIFQISRELIPAAYENEKVVDFPRLTPSSTSIRRMTHSFNLNDPHMQMSYI